MAAGRGQALKPSSPQPPGGAAAGGGMNRILEAIPYAKFLGVRIEEVELGE